MGELFAWLTNHWVELVAALAAVNIGASMLARLTPTKADDELLAKIQAWLDKIASLGFRPTVRK